MPSPERRRRILLDRGEKKGDILHLAKVHETAIVHPEARLEMGVEVGPYSIIGEEVEIGAGTKIGPHVVIEGHTVIGKKNQIYAGVIIGYPPMHLEYRDQRTKVTIGSYNTIREYTTIHRALAEYTGETKIGDHNYLMAYCHITHDCLLGDHIIMVNGTGLAGHVLIEDRAFLGGNVGVHQFCRIGSMAMIGANSKVVKDVPPYMLVDGHPAVVRGVNVVGLKRNNVSSELRKEIKRAYRLLYRSNLNVSEALERIDQDLNHSQEIESLICFVKNAQRGICR